MADMLATSYARPNIVVEGCQADNEDLNANFDRSSKCSPSSTPRKLSPARLKRRTQVEKDKEKKNTSQGSDSKNLDLINSNLQDSDMTEVEKELSHKLLEESKKATERFKNRRGRRWSPSTSPDQRSLSTSPSSERSCSPSPSQPSLAKERDVVPDRVPNNLTEVSSSEKQVDLPDDLTIPTTDKVTEGTAESTAELQEERTGAEGESDKEDNKLTLKSEERKDSEVEVFDIKADILKATGPLLGEIPQAKPVVPLAKLREEHKLQRKTNMLFTMPDLTEATESETAGREMTMCLLPTPTPESPHLEIAVSPREETCKIDEDEEKSIIPNAVLRKLGLKGEQTKDTSAMTEYEIEEKFNSLQLAFKANQYTLQQRVALQHRQRDLVEQNVEKEIEAILQTLQMLEPLASVDLVSRDYINKIRQHVEVFQSSSLRLSSKAEGFGAVQQEGRLSKATDVMITHVENLKRLFEREHAELEDARKLLQENRKMFRGSSISNNLSIDGETDSRLLNRRALSVSGSNAKSTRQRRIGIMYHTIPSSMSFESGKATHSNELDQSSRLGGVRRTSVQLTQSLNTADFKEAKARLTGNLGAIAAKARHAVLSRTDSALMISRRRSDEGSQEHLLLDGTTSAPTLSPASPMPSPVGSDSVSLPGTPIVPSFPKIVDPETLQKSVAKVESTEAASGSKREDEVFQKGYEQGVRTQVSQELCELREQQKDFVDNLEDLIDQAEEQEEEEQKQIRQLSSTNSKILRHLQAISRRWPRVARITRLTLTVCAFLFALVCVILTVVPLEACLKGGGAPITYSPWRTVKELLWPYTELRHKTPPPR